MSKTNFRINVSLPRRSYQIVIGGKGLQGLGEEVLKAGFHVGTKILIVTNAEIAKHYGKMSLESLQQKGFIAKQLIVESGEKYKNLDTISLIHNEAYKNQLERGSLMIALGGGIIGDLTGFAAATWLRGISVIQVPTTLLAMVDASIGGKTGVNHSGGKNLIGSFHQPKLVLIDPKTLKTLANREYCAGMAEVIKYGIIADSLLFSKLEKSNNIQNVSNIEENELVDIIYKSADTKAKIVINDELESGQRAILNYGHTFGHAIEKLCGYGTFLHGEAVAIGMVAAGELALEKGIWDQVNAIRQIKLIQKAGLPTEWPNINDDDVWEVLKSDKKVKNGKVRFILPKSVGSVEIRDDISKSEVVSCLVNLRNRFFKEA